MTIHKPSRFRRFLKWAGLVMCGVVLAVWGISTRHGVHYNSAGVIGPGPSAPGLKRESCWSIHIVSGYFTLGWGIVGSGPNNQWFASSAEGSGFSLPGFRRWGDSLNSMCFIVWCPLWLILLGSALPTVLLWYRDRHVIPPGCCQRCGYDLTSNISGICPECGEACNSESTRT